jgi:enoyl-[acyl-carrier-protein] reductase (NADH)
LPKEKKPGDSPKIFLTAYELELYRNGPAKEVGETVVLLLSDKTNRITGQTLIVDGGLM